MRARGYRLPKNAIPCKFARHFVDRVPMPFGSGDCSMPGFECEYSGDILIPDSLVCNEDNSCPAYEPVKTTICREHDEEYFDWCSQCRPESEEWS